MGLAYTAMDIIKQVLDMVHQDETLTRRIVSLGYPDILLSQNDIANIFGDEIIPRLKYREDSEKIIRWHSFKSDTNLIVESIHFFSLLGFELDVIDITKARGFEIIIDLNEPILEEMKQSYALVIDAGTCEHCFNIGQAIKNVASMVSLNGYVYQNNPLNMYNHGFYNINPTLYHDFYLSNGFTINLCKFLATVDAKQVIMDVPANERFKDVPDNCCSIFIAKRNVIQPLTDPIQTKYKKNPNLLG